VSGHRVLRSVVALTCACCVSIGTVGAATSLGTRAPRVGPVRSQRTVPTTASNRRAAVLDAKELLAGVVPPAGAVLRSSGTGTGTRVPLLTTAFASAVAYSTWIVPGDPASVVSFVEAHLPPGSTLVSTGSGGNPSSQSVVRSWPVVEGILDVRWLEVEVTSHAGGTLLYAESQSQWVVTRPFGERIPPGVREVDVSSGWPGKPQLTRRLGDRRLSVGLGRKESVARAVG
jgi:hypothetical protein